MTQQDALSWSERFNALDREMRDICVAVMAEHRLNDLKRQRRWMVESHKRELAKLDELIRNVESQIERCNEEASSA